MADKQKKALVSGYLGFYNFGDDMMLDILAKHLKEKGYTVKALCNNRKAVANSFGIKTANYKNPFSVIFSLLETNLLVSGGGNLIQNETSFWNLIYYLTIILLAKLFFKKVIIYSQGIGPIKGVFSELLAKIILRLPDVITVRDVASQRILSKWGIRSNYVIDALWSIEVTKGKPENAIGVQVRRTNKHSYDFYIGLAKYIDLYFSDYEIRIFSFQNAIDLNDCYIFEKELRRKNPMIKTKVIPYKSPGQIINDFSTLKYFIGMRYHANILALKYGINTLPINYSLKVKNLADEFMLRCIQVKNESEFNDIFAEFVKPNKPNTMIENAKKHSFNWYLIDSVIDKEKK